MNFVICFLILLIVNFEWSISFRFWNKNYGFMLFVIVGYLDKKIKNKVK